MPVTEIAQHLPNIATLKARSQAIALLDAILSPEWGDRNYSYNCRWADGQELASMLDPAGDDYFIVFSAGGAFVKGFAHESSMSPWREQPMRLWPGILDNLPEVLLPHVDEPAFGYGGLLQATFCLWRQPHDQQWQIGNIDYTGTDPIDADPDGADWLLHILTDPTPASYLRYAAEYFEVEPDPAPVTHIYQSLPLTDDIAHALNPGIDLNQLAGDLAEIGYPR